MLLAALMLSTAGADAAKRRTFKAKTNETTTEVRTVEENPAEPERTAPQAAESRSSRRKASLPEASQVSQEAVKNTPPKNTGKTTAKTAAPKKADKKNDNQPTLMKIKVEKPDLKEIQKATLDPKSKFYYPNLWSKYKAKDMVMTPEEFRYLYLGYMFQEDYDPYRMSPYNEYTDAMRDKESYTDAEKAEIINMAEKSLNDNPFDLRQISFLVHMLNESEKFNKAKVWEFRLENLLGAIKSTGTGADVDNAWYVIYPMHEYDMVQLLGYKAVDVDYVDSGFDHLIVEPDGSVKISKPVKGFYFNVEVPQRQYMEKHPEEL